MQSVARRSLFLGSALVTCSLFSAGCSSLIAYSGRDVEKLKNSDQVRETFGTPTNLGKDDNGREFEEYRTRRKISEPAVASVNFILGTETLGLFELWNFPAAIVQNTWVTFFGQTVRFEYGSDGTVENVCINGTLMEHRATLP